MPRLYQFNLTLPVLNLQTLCFACLGVLLVLVPMPFGSNRLWASNLIGIWSALLLVGVALLRARQSSFWPTGAPTRSLRIGLTLYLLVIGWGWLQTQSWVPSGLHHTVWQYVSTDSGSVSLSPERFAECAVRMLSYLAVFLTAFFVGRVGPTAKLLIKLLAIAGGIYALYGLWIQATGSASILIWPKTAYREFVTSTFINKNSYATYAGLGLLCCLALLWNSLKHAPKQATKDASLATLRLQRFLRRDSFYVVLALMLVGALILTSSRAGIFSSMAGCLIFIILLAINRRWRWTQWLPALAITLFVLSLLILFSGNFLLERLDQDQLDAASAIRLNLYTSTLAAIADRPWLGHGLGSFTDAIRLYAEIPTQRWFDHAHNDYLELALELGIPASLMLGCVLLIILAHCWRGALKRNHLEICPILALSATALVGLHGLFDFSLQIPAIAITYAALLGLGMAQSWSTREKDFSG